MRLVCACGAQLGRVMNGLYFMQHRHRAVVARELVAIRCDRCGTLHQLAPGALPAEIPADPQEPARVLTRA